ncbi:MAG: hypothetical protein NTU43_06700 [Bacteroidetes bacterium]|nr:hypothetical protein [Bacteroidota bacterium]
MKVYKYFLIICASIILAPAITFAQDKEAKITLNFEVVDSQKVCKALVVSEALPVKELSIKFYVKRLFSLLPIGEATTDENGSASLEFPTDIPGGETGNLTVIAKITEDENYMDTETTHDIKWGVIVKEDPNLSHQRSLWGSRSDAPIYFMVASDLIILAIWGTLIYIVFQVFKMKRISSLNKK